MPGKSKPRPKSYAAIPSFERWKEDSAVGGRLGPWRRSDPTLVRIDGLMKDLEGVRDGGSLAYLLGEIFFATLYWLNNHKKNKKMDDGRRPAIQRLNLTAGKGLAEIHGIPLSAVAATLQRIYGKPLSYPGGVGKPGNMLSIAKAESFKLVFKNGKAYRFDCLNKTGNPAPNHQNLVIADTRDYAALQKKINRVAEDWRFGGEEAGYVLSMSREFYVGPFTSLATDEFKENFAKFHSDFMRNKPVQCAGVITIRKGRVTEISNKSGHYKPSDPHLVKAIIQLETVGMNPKKIAVSNVNGQSINGDEFIQQNGNWETIRKKTKQGTWKRFEDMLSQEGPTGALRICVTDRFLALKDAYPERPKEDVWGMAYFRVCRDLGQFDPQFKLMSRMEPTPFNG